jgi:hypothetical protein
MQRDLAVVQRRKRQYRVLSSISRFVDDGAAQGRIAGRMRNHSPFDCGRTRCGVCHSEKRFGRPSHKHLSVDEAFQAQLQDL